MQFHENSPERETMKCAEKHAPRASSSAGNSPLVFPTQSSREVRVKMNFQHRYYKMNRFLLKCIGQWPYQTTRARRSYAAVLLFVTIGHILSEIMAGVKYRNDKEILLECISLLIFVASCLMKATCSIWNSQKMLKLLNHIRTDWQVWAHDQEINILHRYADHGRKITIAYAGYSSTMRGSEKCFTKFINICRCCVVTIYSNGVLFMIQPLIPKIIDVLLKNGSEPGKFPIAVDYYVLDMQKYYFHLIVYSCVCACVAILVTVALDAIFIVYVLHGCGIFAALGHKLERVGVNYGAPETEKVVFALAKKDMHFEHLASCIDRHNDAIVYTELIEATYSWYFFFIMGLNMLVISITGLQIIKKTNDLEETIKFLVWLLVYVMRLYIESHMCQMLMDHSIGVHYCIHNGEWYSLSLKAQKLLPLMSMRCSVPCELTAGKIVVMSMRTFVVFLKTSISYFTLLRSM